MGGLQGLSLLSRGLISLYAGMLAGPPLPTLPQGHPPPSSLSIYSGPVRLLLNKVIPKRIGLNKLPKNGSLGKLHLLGGEKNKPNFQWALLRRAPSNPRIPAGW